MSELRLSPQAEAELDGIWIYIARESGSTEAATRLVEGITERFWLPARNPYMGRRRDHDLRRGLRSLVAGDYVLIHSIVEDDVVLILHVVHGHRDLAALFGH
jgi:plasmid stabilization system protein ParE